jgi:DamX protein
VDIGTIRVAPAEIQATKKVLQPASWLANIDFITHLILANDVMISVLSEKGSGKTTFSSLLSTSLPPQIKPYLISANPLFDSSVFLQQLDVLSGGMGALSISNFIAQCNEHESHALLVIDDAHYLSAPFIEDLLDGLQQQGRGGHFHVCLVSDFSLVPTLNNLADDTYADMIHSIELGLLNESETKTLVIQNMLARPGAEKLITDERINQFYQLTEGHIEKINHQMVDFFSYIPTKKSHTLMSFRHLGIAAGVFFAVSGLVYVGLSNNVQQAPEQLVRLEPQPVPELSLESGMSSDIPAYTVAASRQALEVTSLRRVELGVSEDEDGAPDESMAVVDKVIVAPKIVHVQAKKNPVTIKRVIQTAVVKSKIEQNLYTIQILASHNMNELKNFARAHHLDAKTRVRRTQRQGTVWYVLTLGEYTQRQHAKQAVSHLPKDIAQLNPWVRAITDLKTTG